MMVSHGRLSRTLIVLINTATICFVLLQGDYCAHSFVSQQQQHRPRFTNVKRELMKTKKTATAVVVVAGSSSKNTASMMAAAVADDSIIIAGDNDDGVVLLKSYDLPKESIIECLGDEVCDELASNSLSLWSSFPPGAQRDIIRYCRTEQKQLALNRIATMKEMLQYVEPYNNKEEEDDVWIWKEAPWRVGVTKWENEQQKQRDEAIAKAKAERKARMKANAAAMAAEAAAKKEKEEDEAKAATAKASEKDDEQNSKDEAVVVSKAEANKEEEEQGFQ